MRRVLYWLVSLIAACMLLLGATGCRGERADGPGAAAPGGSPLNIRMLDIGQGDAILLEKDGEWALIDSGDVDHRPQMKAYLKEYGVTRLSKVIITHAHADHVGGMLAVFQTVKVGEIYDSGVPTTTNTYRTYLKQIQAKKIPFHTIKTGDTITLFPGVDFQVAGPVKVLKEGKSGKPDLNNNSIVGRLVYGNFSMLFTGDAEKEEEKSILAVGKDLKSQVLKVGHHGSKTSSSAVFLRAVSPELALISAGAGNSYGLPHPVTLKTLEKAGVRTLRTDRDGTITLTTDGQGYTVTARK